MISNKTIKTEQPVFNFYYEDIITYIKKQNSILDLQNNSKKLYKEILQNEYSKYLIVGQSIWDQYYPQNPWNLLFLQLVRKQQHIIHVNTLCNKN